MTTVAAPSANLFFETAFAYQRTAALKAAVELELFAAIGEGFRTDQDIAKRTSASVRGTRMLCDYLTVLGFLRKHRGEYTLTEDSAFFLDKRSPAYMGGTFGFLAAPNLVRNFDHLTTTVRAGHVAEDGNTVAEENPLWVEFARAMVPLAVPAAQAIAELLDVSSEGPLKVLDIAAGHGMYGITIAQRNPRAEIHAADWRQVLEVAKEHAERAGVAARYHTIPGDAFRVDVGTDYDVALVTNFLHHFDEPTCTGFLKKVAGSLKSGGRVAILDFVPDDDRVSPPLPASFVMNMLGGTPAGDVYPFGELERMLVAAGFRDATMHETPTPQTVIVATK
jgi:SAM-dependent methyltransferase